jgi:hypothetical protein
MRQRPAATLVEVLVAIFVMGIGLLALLALFPLGALSMAQAIKDDRTSHAAANGAAIAEALAIRNDLVLVNANYDTFSNMVSNTTIPLPLGPLPQGHPELPSYAVYVDPTGFNAFTALGAFSIWVGGTPGVARRSVSFVNPEVLQPPALLPLVRTQRILRWFTLQDDMAFYTDSKVGPMGTPNISTGAIQRDGRYSWGVLLRRPRSIVTSVVEATVVVYSQRPLGLTAAGAIAIPSGEVVYAAPPTGPTGPTGYSNRKGDTIITISIAAGQERPPIRKGSWILDGSIERALSSPPTGWSHGFFYRVVGVTDIPGGMMDLEVQTPLRESVYSLPPNGSETWAGLAGQPIRSRDGLIVVMENVAEVFEKGPGWLP